MQRYKGRRAMGPGAGLVIGLIMLAAALTGCDVGAGAASTTTDTTPVPVPTALVRGEAVFTRYCQVCHPGGNRGVGDRLIGIPISDDQIKSVVRNGKKNMPAFTVATIPDDDLSSLVNYIRSLK